MDSIGKVELSLEEYTRLYEVDKAMKENKISITNGYSGSGCVPYYNYVGKDKVIKTTLKEMEILRKALDNLRGELYNKIKRDTSLKVRLKFLFTKEY